MSRYPRLLSRYQSLKKRHTACRPSLHVSDVRSGLRPVRQCLRRRTSVPSLLSEKRRPVWRKTTLFTACRHARAFPGLSSAGHKKGRPFSALQTEMDGRIYEEISMAEGKGFEPLVGSRPQRFSRPPHSTALPSLRKTAQKALSFSNVIYPGARCQPERPSAAPHGIGRRTGHLSRREAAPEQIRNRLIFFLQTE